MEGYMNNLLSANISNATAWGTILVIFFAIIAKFFKTWLRARLAKAPVSMSNMLGMWLRNTWISTVPSMRTGTRRRRTA